MKKTIRTTRDIATAVRGRRQELGLSQAEAARKAHVSRQWLSEFESGKPRAEISLMMRLLDSLGLDMILRAQVKSSDLKSFADQVIDLDSLLEGYRKND